MALDERRAKIVQTLKEKKAIKACPRCGTKKFAILNGFFNPIIDKDPGTISIQDSEGTVSTIPCAVIVCKNCGFISQHALGRLEQLPKEEDGSEKA
jgi:hypothetical protein